MRKLIYTTSDDISINGILEENNSDTCVIMCHGIRSGKEEHGKFTKIANQLNFYGIDSYRFDFRGHGDNPSSSELISVSGEVIDLETVIEEINNLGYKRIILLGMSFGGGAISLIDYSKYNNIIGLVLWYPTVMFDKTDLFSDESVERAVKDGYLETRSVKTGRLFKFSKKLMLETREYIPYKKLVNNNLKKLFIQGDKDTSTPCEYAIKCAEESPNSKIEIIQDGIHGFFDNDEHIDIAIEITIEFILKLLEQN